MGNESNIFTPSPGHVAIESDETPPVTPTSSVTGPYIPLNQCMSGRTPNLISPLRSPNSTDKESVFTDEESPSSTVPWLAHQKQTSVASDCSADSGIKSIPENKKLSALGTVPPRPPKPPHLIEIPHTYLNIDSLTTNSLPRSYKSGSQQQEQQPDDDDDRVFRYDFTTSDKTQQRKHSMQSPVYYNFDSSKPDTISGSGPPKVNRKLKPAASSSRRNSESCSSPTTPASHPAAPIINRTLKPAQHRRTSDSFIQGN